MIAILINAHKNFNQLKRLINELRNEEVDIYIHVDKKSEIKTDEFSGVHFISKRFDVRNEDISQVDATIFALKEIVIHNYSHCILMSGQGYPIIPINTIINFLKNNPDKEFIECKKIGKHDYNIEENFTTYHFSIHYENKVIKKLIPSRKFINNLIPYGGSPWWILTIDAISHVINYYEENNFSNYFKYSKSMNQVIFQTILANSKFKYNIINNSLWYTNYNILKKDDFDKIITSNKFFARKFDVNIDSEILDMLDNYRRENDFSNIRNPR